MHPAFVLHQRPYGESSQLVELFTRDAGRIGAMARGARRPKSAWRGILQPFVPLLVEWRGRGELDTLTSAEPAAPIERVPGARIPAGWYLNELMLRLFQRADPHIAVFDAYASVIQLLAGSDPLDAPLREFEVLLLAEIGYAPLLTFDAESGDPVDAVSRYLYRRDEGPVATGRAIPSPDDSPANVESPRDLERGVQRAETANTMPVAGRALLALAGQADFDRESLRDAKRLTRFLLEPHLGDRALSTRTLLLDGPRA